MVPHPLYGDGEQGCHLGVGRNRPTRLGCRSDGGSDAESPAGRFGGLALAIGGPEAAIGAGDGSAGHGVARLA